MATLIYEISGNNTGLANAVNDSIALLQNLQKTANGINLGGQSVKGLSAAIIDANNQALNLKKTASDTSLSFQDKAGITALDALGRKLLVIKGNTELFGDSIKSQQAELTAYQGTLNKLLSAGFDPLNGDVTRLKANIDGLTASIAEANAAQVKPKTIALSRDFNESDGLKSNFSDPVPIAGGSISANDALIKEFNKDLDSGKISATEYAAAIKNIGVSTTQTNVKIAEEQGLLVGLNTELRTLKTAKLQIVNPADLAKQNALIQELEAEISRFGNVGKAGFDSAGVAIKGFGKETEQAEKSSTGFGSSLRSGYGTLRQLAFILPGIGIAGIFNLAFTAIAAAASELEIFNSKTTVAESNLANLNEVTKNAGKQFGEQSTNLRILYTATQDVSNSEKERLLAAQELQKEFPSLFGNIKTETILNGGAADAYRDATAAILDNAKAKAAATKISELAGRQLENEFKLVKISNALANENARVKPVTQGAQGFGLNDSAPVQFNAKQQAQSIIDQKASNAARAKLSVEEVKQNTKDLQAQIDFLTKFAGGNNKIAAALSEGQKLPKDKTVANLFLDLNKQIDDLLAKTQNLAQASGLTGYAAAVQKITTTYEGLNRAVDEFNKKVGADVKSGKLTKSQGASLLAKSSNVSSVLPGNQSKELSDAAIAEANRVATEIQRINDEFGVKAEQSRGREIAQVSALADKEIAKAQLSALTKQQIEDNYQKAIANGKGNQELLQDAETLRDAEIQQAQNVATEVVAIQEGKVAAIRAINDKYIQLENDLWDKISLIDSQAQSEIGDKTTVETGKIIKEWETRRDAANKYYDELIKISKSDSLNVIAGFNATGLVANLQRGKTNTGITNAETADVNLAQNKNLLSGLDQAATGFVGDFLSGLENANSEIGANFQSVFAGIAQSFQKTISTVAISGISTLLKDKLEQGIKDGTIHLSGALQAAIGAAGVAGSLVSGLTPKTSKIGQGIGGALSGAASGALVGSVFGPAGTVAGAVIGGAIGLLGGIFGASKAQKELQKQQLAEQQQQTALLKASLAYTSSIIGRMTTAGIITGVDVGATGQLTATVSGKDLQFVLDRNGR